jgi:Mg-chelatase subunit ChlI
MSLVLGLNPLKSGPSPVYPFTAIVGQEKMKLGLLLTLIHPRIGGLLIRGQRGTAKSTAVRGLINLLPPMEVVADCPFRCPPRDPEGMCDLCRERLGEGKDLPGVTVPYGLVNLPLGASEDRLIGALDFEAALSKGERRFEPGLLARANRSILYVDEVNLLEDHLVDLLLDVAALGVNYVEREGISFSHPSRFILIGTMNPEEGDLRPQLLDRFGLCVDVRGSTDLTERIEVAHRRLSFESDPVGFLEDWSEAENDLARRIIQARRDLDQIRTPQRIWEMAARLSLSYGVEGHRSDLTMIKAAQAIGALRGLAEVTPPDLLEAAELALPHRLKNQDLNQPRLEPGQIQKILDDLEPAQEEPAAASASGELKKKPLAF